MIRVNNYVRCVRGGSAKIRTRAHSLDTSRYPNNIKISKNISPKGVRGSAGRSGHPAERRGFVEWLDRNGDGKISRSEFDGPRDRFSFHDKNSDGYLSEDEAQKGPPLGNSRPPRP